MDGVQCGPFSTLFSSSETPLHPPRHRRSGIQSNAVVDAGFSALSHRTKGGRQGAHSADKRFRHGVGDFRSADAG